MKIKQATVTWEVRQEKEFWISQEKWGNWNSKVLPCIWHGKEIRFFWYIYQIFLRFYQLIFLTSLSLLLSLLSKYPWYKLEQPTNSLEIFKIKPISFLTWALEQVSRNLVISPRFGVLWLRYFHIIEVIEEKFSLPRWWNKCSE